MPSITESLHKIQVELKSPKNLKNNFANYLYRNTESILAAVKPILKEEQCILTLQDEMILLGDRFYLKSTAILSTLEGQEISRSAYAREPLTKKGSDEAQITGACSSYARKYALCGLFAIDDGNSDPDSQEPAAEAKPAAKIKPVVNF
jgi:hypothetical protein